MPLDQRLATREMTTTSPGDAIQTREVDQDQAAEDAALLKTETLGVPRIVTVAAARVPTTILHSPVHGNPRTLLAAPNLRPLLVGEQS